MKQFIWNVRREDCNVWISIHTNLDTCEPVMRFGKGFENQESAELACKHLLETFHEWNEYVASNPEYYIHNEQLSKVKKFLNERWNAKENCWK